MKYFDFFLISVIFTQFFETIQSYRIRNNKLNRPQFSIQMSKIKCLQQFGKPNLKPNLLILSILPLLQSKKSIASDVNSFLDSLAIMIEARSVILPTNEYVEFQNYELARTNAKYILDQLQLQKNVKNLVQQSLEFCDDMDAIEEAQEAGNRITNTLLQFDGSVYTCVFIPSDDGSVPPSALKYRKEANTYYKSFINDISILLKLANESQLQAATEKANVAIKSMPPVLFKKPLPKKEGSLNG